MACNLTITAYDNEDFSHFCRRYMKLLKKSGILREVKEHEFFMSPSEKKHQHDVRRKRANKPKPKGKLRGKNRQEKRLEE